MAKVVIFRAILGWELKTIAVFYELCQRCVSLLETKF